MYLAAAIDKILEDNPHVVAGDPHMPPCTPTRRTPLTGANYPYASAEPDTILFDHNGVAYHATEPLATDWPVGVMKVNAKVEVTA